MVPPQLLQILVYFIDILPSNQTPPKGIERIPFSYHQESYKSEPKSDAPTATATFSLLCVVVLTRRVALDWIHRLPHESWTRHNAQNKLISNRSDRISSKEENEVAVIRVNEQ